MPTFTYRSVTAAGDIVSGDLDVPDQQAAVAHLHRLGHTPLSIDAGERSRLMAALNTELFHLGGPSEREVLALTRSLATLLDAGIALDRALGMCRDLHKAGPSRAVADDLLRSIQEGRSLAEALDAHPKVFNGFYRNMVRAGEAGASLGDVLSRLADHMERSRKLAARVRSALIYPAFLVVAALAAVLILLTVVVPTFEPMFQDAGAALPTSTAIVIATGRFFESYWWALIAGIAGGGVGLAMINANPKGRLWWHGLLLRIPVLGGVWLKAAVARIARTLAVLLENGVALPQAMTLAEGVAGNARIAGEVARVAGEVQLGRGLSGPFKVGDLFPTLAVQLVQVGEESGRLEPMMHKLADIYEDETRTALDQLVALLVPVLTLVIGVIIAFIVSSILFALFSINELAR